MKTIDCRKCQKPIDLFPGYLLASDSRHPKNVFVCPVCGQLTETVDRKNPGVRRHCRAGLSMEGPAKRNRCECTKCGTSNTFPNRPWERRDTGFLPLNITALPAKSAEPAGSLNHLMPSTWRKQMRPKHAGLKPMPGMSRTMGFHPVMRRTGSIAGATDITARCLSPAASRFGAVRPDNCPDHERAPPEFFGHQSFGSAALSEHALPL